MGIFDMWHVTADERDKGKKMFWSTFYVLAFVLAVYLAIKDMHLLPNTASKIWVLLLAVIWPEGFIVLTGISTSSMGVGFFSGTPITAAGSDWFKPKGSMGGTMSFDAPLGASPSPSPSSSSLF